ncbi:PQQ-dependent sugar dehydrogenase [Haloferax namakaokahaiae]|uniref:PQQ-dependent sugar dehydrogenase n=1 Tax=Haloferax namakaokahaiae TaxID=1748331 RepID=A0ABD5ZDP8_9EURY
MSQRSFSRRSLLAGLCLGSLSGCLSQATTNSLGQYVGANSPVTDEYDLSVGHAPVSTATAWEVPTTAPPTSLSVEPVVEGLEIPWDVTFAPNGDLFVSERPGRILHYRGSQLETAFETADVVEASPVAPGGEGGWWAAGSEGGLMGIAVHPNYPDVPVVYAFYTYDAEDGTRNRLSCFDVSADDPAATETVLIDGILGANVHNGSRVAFGPENYLWVTIGDAAEESNAADVTTVNGAVLRLEPDGSAPSDNPDFGPDADPRLYTVGHRNPQGITWLPDGTPLVTEHGPGGADEVNRLVAGGDYGWGTIDPTERGEVGYTDSTFERPLVNTGKTTWAPPGCVFYTGSLTGLQNRLVIGGLRSQRLNVVTLAPRGETLPGTDSGTVFDAPWMDDEYVAVAHTLFEDELGRIRDVTQAPDGSLLVATSNRDGRTEIEGESYPIQSDDRLLRVVPASE